MAASWRARPLRGTGVPTQTLSPAELAKMEPALAPIFHRALWIQGSYSGG